MARQQDEEDLVDHCKRFVSVNEMVEQAHGEIAPLVVAKKNTTPYGKIQMELCWLRQNKCWLFCL